MKTITRLVLFVSLWYTPAFAQVKGSLNKVIEKNGGVKNTLETTKGELMQMANTPVTNTSEGGEFWMPLVTIETKDPVTDYVFGESESPVSYSFGYKSWVVYDEWWKRMSACIDKLGEFWNKYPGCITAQKKDELVKCLGETNETKAFMKVVTENNQLAGVFLFYDGYYDYYRWRDFIPMKKYAGKASFSVEFLAADAFDFYTPILNGNLSSLQYNAEAPGKNKGKWAMTGKFLPLK